MKVPETYEEFLKTPKEELEKLVWQKMPIEDSHLLITFALKSIEDFADKDKLISEEKRKTAKSLWEMYCE